MVGPAQLRDLPGVPANFQHVSFCQLQAGCIVMSDIRLTRSDLLAGAGPGAVTARRLAAKMWPIFHIVIYK